MIKTILTASIFLFNAANVAVKYNFSRVQLPRHTEGHPIILKNSHRIMFPISSTSSVRFNLNQGITSQNGVYCLLVTAYGVVITSSDGNIVYWLFSTNVPFFQPEFWLTYQETRQHSKMWLTYHEKWQNYSSSYKYGQRTRMIKKWITDKNGGGSIEVNNFGELVFSVNDTVIKSVGRCASVQLPDHTVGNVVILLDDENPHRITFPMSSSSAVRFTLNQGIKSQNGAYCLIVLHDGVVLYSRDGNIVHWLFSTDVPLDQPEFWLTYQEKRQNSKMWLTYHEKWQYYSSSYKYGRRISMIDSWITKETGGGSIELNNNGQFVFSVNDTVIKTVGRENSISPNMSLTSARSIYLRNKSCIQQIKDDDGKLIQEIITNACLSFLNASLDIVQAEEAGNKTSFSG